jgi:hypothetical protein
VRVLYSTNQLRSAVLSPRLPIQPFLNLILSYNYTITFGLRDSSVKPRKRSKQFANGLEDLDKDIKDIKDRHDKSLKAKNNRRLKASVDESEDESN